MKRVFIPLVLSLTMCFSTSLKAEELGQASTSQVIKSGNKDFITIETEDAKTFYLIIDYDSSTNNVYFLKQVEESDLSSLTKFENLFSDNTTSINSEIIDEVPTKTIEDNNIIINENISEKKIDIVQLGAIVLLAILIIYVLYSKLKSKKTKKNTTYFDDETDDNENLIENLKNKNDAENKIF